MRRSIVSAAVALIIATGCAGSPLAPGPGGGTEDPFAFPSDFPLPGLPGPAALTPTGAQYRFVNAHVPTDGEPGAVDVYGGFGVSEDSQPLVTVPFGEASAWFDPGKFDEDGNGGLIFFAAGVKDQAAQIGSQSTTLEGDERVTLFLSTGKSFEGTEHVGTWTSLFEAGEDFSLPTSPPDQALIYFNTLGLDVTRPDLADQFIFASAGDGCLGRLESGPDAGAQPVGPGTGSTAPVEPGSLSVTLHAVGGSGLPDCKGKALGDPTSVELAAGGRVHFFVFSAGEDDLRTLVLPIE